MIKQFFLKIRNKPDPIKYVTARILIMTGLSRLFLIRCGRYNLRFYPTSLSTALWMDKTDRASHGENLIAIRDSKAFTLRTGYHLL